MARTACLWGLGLIVAGLAASVWVPAPVRAVDGAGFAVSPAFGQLQIRADEPRIQYAVKIANRDARDQSFRLSVVDFGSLDEEGGVAFLGQPTNELEHKYGLASWMKLERELVLVPAGKSVTIGVTIDNRTTLAPGGHYGAVLATAVTDASAKPDGVGVKQVLSSLVLLTKEGGKGAELRLAEQKFKGGFWALPKLVEQRFENTGNVHVTPRGVVEIRDPGGKVVARAAINESSGMVLPESFRRYRTTLGSVAPAWIPGRYQVASVYRHDGIETTQTLVGSVWYVGSAVVWLVGLLALAAVGGLAWWLWWRPRRSRR